MRWIHPCQKCGACCAYFRVSFYWREGDLASTPAPVPSELSQDLSDFLKIMKGTEEKRINRCIALDGKIGSRTSCTIYENRPSPCRNFTASFESGSRNKRCDEARCAHHLKPLTPEDWSRPPCDIDLTPVA